MAWAKRIFVFMAVNLLVMVTISILLKVFGVQPYLTARGINYQSLLAFCLIWGMGGAFISLGLSRVMAKWMMGVQVIPPNTTDPDLQNLLERVHMLARSAGLPKMPEVGIYESHEVNAFATGPTKSRALVAVSTGLLQRMRAEEVDGVLGHEVAHIANGDMVTMTLIQGVVNAFAMFLARVVAYAISMATTRDNREEGVATSGFAYHMTVFVLEIVFMMLGSIVVAWFSRQREFRADKGGARLTGRDKMVGALRALQRTYETIETDAQPAVQTLKISGKGAGIYRLFSTHPSLAARLERLLAAS